MSVFAAIGVCPICGQGRLVIAVEKSSGTHFILCEDCESEWKSPQDAAIAENATRDEFGRSTILTIDDVQDHEWRSFLMK